MKTEYLSKLTITVVLTMLAGQLLAAPPYKPNLIDGGNRWLITFYNDASTTHTQWATQGICFYNAGQNGTHQRYFWISDTYPDWNGMATQEGDQIFMHGDFQYPWQNRDGGHDGMEWQLTTVSRKDEGFGHWKEWVENGKYGVTIGFGNAKFTRVGKCRFGNKKEAEEGSQRLEVPHDAAGNILLPMQIQRVEPAESNEIH